VHKSALKAARKPADVQELGDKKKERVGRRKLCKNAPRTALTARYQDIRQSDSNSHAKSAALEQSPD
jgi:hypothetical protein